MHSRARGVQVGEQVDQAATEWERRVEDLGPPTDPRAVERARQLTASGWELTGVTFGSGRWSFRRPRPADANDADDA
jgi:hypothetical protein